ENKWRSSHSWDADALAAQILNGMDGAVCRGLDAQTAAVNSTGKLHIESLFDRFQEIHHQVLGDVVATQGKRILVIRPITFHQFDLQALFLEEAVFNGA